MIRWGIMATGTIANKFATTINQMTGEARLIACASRDKKRAEEFASLYHIPKAYGSYEELVKDEEIDVIYISTPNNYHFENMKLCIEAGKAVLCEKPFTMNEEQAAEIFALAKEKGVFVMEAFWTKFLPGHQKLLEVLSKNTIGEVRHLRAQFGFIAQGERKNRKFDSSLAGGALLDIGIYNIGFACMVFGYEPTRIVSDVHMNEWNTDDYEMIHMEFGQGKTVSLLSTIGMSLPTEGVLLGTEGVIRFPDYQKAEYFTVERYDGRKEEIKLPFEVSGFEYQIREVNTCIAQGKQASEIQSPEHTRAVLQIMDRLRDEWNLVFDCENKGGMHGEKE